MTLFSFNAYAPPKPVLTPCIGVCEMDARGLCAGCHRTLDEIAHWGSLSESERRQLMAEVLPQRADVSAT